MANLFNGSYKGSWALPWLCGGKETHHNHRKPGGPPGLSAPGRGGVLWGWAEPLLSCGGSRRVCGVAAAGPGMAMGPGVGLQQVRQLSVPHCSFSPGEWDVSGQSRVFMGEPEPCSCLHCTMAFGADPALCGLSAGAAGLSSPGLGCAEGRANGAEPVGPQVTQVTARPGVAPGHCLSARPHWGSLCPLALWHHQGLVRVSCC